MTEPIYMDYQATTPVDPRALEAMLPYFSECFGNAASRSHAWGWRAQDAVEAARDQVASLIAARSKEIVFTSGATESNNLALKGVARAATRGDHIVTVETEHKAVLDSCRALESEGFTVTRLRPRPDGLISPEQVAGAVTARTVLVSIMHVNNEIGVIQPIAELARAARAANPSCLIHCDAAQSAGKIPIDVSELGVDVLSMSAHKLYGPKGIGALWVRSRPRVAVRATIDGGGHERGLRSGTLPVPLIVGFGAACELAAAELEHEAARILALRTRLLDGLESGIDGVSVNGSLRERVAGNLNVSFSDVDGDALLVAIGKDVAVSSSSACTSASLEPSYVLSALGVPDRLANASIRFGLGRFTTEHHVDRAIELVCAAVVRLQSKGP